MNIQINVNKNANTYAGSDAEALPVTNEFSQNIENNNPQIVANKQEPQDGTFKPQVMLPDGSYSWEKVSEVPANKETTETDSGSDFDFAKGMTDMFTSFIEGFKSMMQEYMSQIKEMVSGIMDEFLNNLPISTEPPAEAPKDPAPTPMPSPKPTPAPDKPEVPEQREMKSFAERVPEIMAGNMAFNSVNEADLQAGVAAYQLYQKSEDAEQHFLAKYNEAKDKGGMNPNEAIKHALIETKNAGKISKSEAEFVYSLSHRASQIDDNHNDVNAGKSGAETIDPNNGIKGAEIVLAQVVQGKIVIEPRPLF